MARLLSPEDVLTSTFTQTQFREGYDEREVDVLLDEVVAALRQHAAGAPAGLAARQVEATRFTATRFRRGYDQAEIDAFLVDVVHTLRHHESGGRAGAQSPPVDRTRSAGARGGTSAAAGGAATTGPATGERTPSFGARVLRFLRGDKG